MEVTFSINLNLNIPQLVEIAENLLVELVTQRQSQEQMMATIDEVMNEVRNNSNVIDSAVTTINRLADQVEANLNNPAALQQIVDELRSKDAGLAEAIAASTPAEGSTGSDPATGPSGSDDGTGTATENGPSA